ncbi:MAG: TatD family hydrolase [Marinifilaceae bacterium]|jgi:TatD DNase family protein|nr:TatD family hydrolase [Marinifilaceae bacterium]
MYLIDSHSHIYLDEFKDNIAEVIDRAKANDIKKILLPNIDSNSIKQIDKLVSLYPDICLPMMGIHPCYIESNYKNELEHAENWLSQNKAIAIGEIGIDLYWEKKYIKEQKEAFDYQIELAKKHNIPVVVHCRDAFNEIFDVLQTHKQNLPTGVLHSFTGEYQDAKKLLDMGFNIGVNGIVSFKKSHLPEVLKKIPYREILIETDSPYLAPVPKRGKRNESSYLIYTFKFLAELYKIDEDKLKKIIFNTTNRLFKLNISE